MRSPWADALTDDTAVNDAERLRVIVAVAVAADADTGPDARLRTTARPAVATDAAATDPVDWTVRRTCADALTADVPVTAAARLRVMDRPAVATDADATAADLA